MPELLQSWLETGHKNTIGHTVNRAMTETKSKLKMKLPTENAVYGRANDKCCDYCACKVGHRAAIIGHLGYFPQPTKLPSTG